MSNANSRANSPACGDGVSKKQEDSAIFRPPIVFPKYHDVDNPRHDLPRGGQKPATAQWYRSNFSANFNNDQLVKGFNITHTGHEVGTQWLILELFNNGLKEAAMSTNADKCYFDESIDEFYKRWPELHAPGISFTWRNSAIWGWVSYAQARLARIDDFEPGDEQIPVKRTWSTYDEQGNRVKSTTDEGSPSKRRKTTKPPLFSQLAIRVSHTEADGSRSRRSCTLWLEELCTRSALVDGETVDLDVTSLDWDALQSKLESDKNLEYQRDRFLISHTKQLGIANSTAQLEHAKDQVALVNAIIDRRFFSKQTCLDFGLVSVA